jgi:hypothetical protein
MLPMSWPSQVMARSVVSGKRSHPGHVSVEGVPVIWVLRGEGGHLHRFGGATLIEQRVQVGIFGRP